MIYDAIGSRQGEEYRRGKELRAVLLDSVTHDLRSPLTSIKASVTALLANTCTEPFQRDELLAVIDEEADRLNELVNEALETAQLLIARLDIKPHSIEEIILAAEKRCRNLIGQRQISVELAPGLAPVRADFKRVTKALVQLLENALKYSPPGRPITITAEAKEASVVTSVKDRGCGIRKSEQALIFEKFYRGKDHRCAVPGSGMGLPIANAIIKAHRGSLKLTSRWGQGSTFIFSLPT